MASSATRGDSIPLADQVPRGVGLVGYTSDKHLSEQIAWYTRNKAEVLAYQDHFVAELDLNRLHTMGRKTKKRLLGTLDKLRKRHQIERDQRLDNQRTILQCFGLVNKDPTKEGVT